MRSASRWASLGARHTQSVAIYRCEQITSKQLPLICSQFSGSAIWAGLSWAVLLLLVLPEFFLAAAGVWLLDWDWLASLVWPCVSRRSAQCFHGCSIPQALFMSLIVSIC